MHDDINPDEGSHVKSISESDAENFVRDLGLVFSNTFIYGENHSVTKKAKEDSFTILSKIFDGIEEILINITDDGIFLNNLLVEQKNPLMRMFATQLTAIDLTAFSITKGISRDDFDKLLDILNAKPNELRQLGGFSSLLSSSGLENVRAKKITYKQVAEDEVIVSSDTLNNVGGESSESIKQGDSSVNHDSSSMNATGKDGETTEESMNVGAILAFLKGDVSGDDEAVQKQVKDMSLDANKLGDLIMRSVDIRQESADLEGAETFGGLVVGSLRRTYKTLSKDSSVKTQKGKKKLTKTLMLLEQNILDKMRKMVSETDSDDIQNVSDTIEDMVDELKMDMLTEEYLKKRNAVKKSEKDILRYMKSKGPDNISNTELKEKLIDGGLDTEGWKQLLIKSDSSSGHGSGLGSGSGGGGFGSGSGGGGIAAIGRLASFLVHMEETIESSKDESGEIKEENISNVVTQVDKEVANLTNQTEQKIRNLVDLVNPSRSKTDKEEGEGKMSIDKLLETLAEIVQEFCQPLSVVNCSIDMIKAGSLGEINVPQEDMLTLASTSGERLQKLIDKLMKISGVPDSLAPDANIQSSLYE